jgi:thiol-disulfide isomerase/thioredoxin
LREFRRDEDTEESGVLDRALFLKSALSFVAAAATPSPSPSATPMPWDMCEQSDALPYDKPLELKMRVLDGPDFDLMKYRGHPTLLHIFATWCEPCALEMPHIVDIANAYAQRGLQVVGIDFRESDNTVRAYRKKYGITFPIAMDERGLFVEALENGRVTSVSFPASLYITADGYLYCYTKGTTTNPGPELTYRIEKFLKDASS